MAKWRREDRPWFLFAARSVAERRFSIDEETHVVRSFADESF
jgi:hypothetical protein